MSKGTDSSKTSSLLMNLHGNVAGHFTELRLMQGKHRKQSIDLGCSPGLFIPDPLLSVLLTETYVLLDDYSFCLLGLLPHLGAAGNSSQCAGPRGTSFLHQRDVC